MTDATARGDVDLDALKARLLGSPVLSQVAEIALYVLKEKAATIPDRKMSADAIWERAEQLLLPFGAEKATFHAYLSRIVREAEYPITSTGRGRGGGYYLSTLAVSVAEQVAQQSGSGEEQPKGEAALYPVVREWLLGQGYQSRITAQLRGLGKWANPDVTGLAVAEHLGRLELEIVTVEVKVSLAQWEYWFFEAVAHRRFANRAFFAFPMAEELADKTPSQLRYMCELYQVGALLLVMPDELYRDLQGGKLNKPLSLDEVTVQEINGAPWSRVSLGYQKTFCEAVDISDLGALFRWGGGA